MDKTRLNEIVEELYPRFKGMDEYFKKYDENGFSTFCHSITFSGGISMQIRNEYNLWDEDSENHKYFKKEFGESHPDGMSSIITKEIYKKYQNENT